MSRSRSRSRDTGRYPLKLLLNRCEERFAVTSDYADRVRRAREERVWATTYGFATMILGLDFFDAMLLADWAVFISATEDP